MQYKNANISLLRLPDGVQAEIVFPGGKRVTTMTYQNEHDPAAADRKAIEEAKVIINNWKE